MKSSLNHRNVALFLSTALLVFALGISIFVANQKINNWLLSNSVDQIVAKIAKTLTATNTASEVHELISQRNTASMRTVIGSMRLGDETASAQSPETKAAPPLEPSQVLSAVLESVLSPSRILGTYVASGLDLSPEASGPTHLSQFARDQRMPRHLLDASLAKLPTVSGPFTVLDAQWSGVSDSRSFVVIPHFMAGKVDGALVIVADHSAQITSLSVITKIASLVVAALCIGSFLLAAFLLWMRFHQQVKANRDIEYLAHHDPLTGLPNRAVFSARLNEALRLAHAKASNMAVMLIDVDKFKEVNDTHGHGTGDIFLQIIADRLRSVFGDHLVARLSGDEFAVMIKSVSDVARLTRLAADMISATKPRCNIDGTELSISLSIGIARASDGSWRASRLLHCADLALYRAKHSGRSTFAWYTAEMDADAQKRKEIEQGLEKALRLDQFDVLYQPQYSLIDNKLKGYEALIRWEHPSKGTISPEVFIPIAEDSGLIEAIGDWVLFHACKEAASWEDDTLRVAVNVSAAQFKPGVTEAKVAQALAESGLAPERLEIEITESLLIANTDAVIETLKNISAIGVAIAMDDFGTGYSSLSYLSRFPFDKIKIDRSFIKNIGHDVNTDAVVASIIGLGRSLNVLITAEGVENQKQVTLLRAAGCNLVQGFLFGRPDTIAAHINKGVAMDTQSMPVQAQQPQERNMQSDAETIGEEALDQGLCDGEPPVQDDRTTTANT